VSGGEVFRDITEQIAIRAAEHALQMLQRYWDTRAEDDLSAATEALRRCLAVDEAPPAVRAESLSGLGFALQERFRLTGEPAALQEAVAAGREAVRSAPPGHPVRALCAAQHARGLRIRLEADEDPVAFVRDVIALEE
jgi:hypothetical protein